MSISMIYSIPEENADDIFGCRTFFLIKAFSVSVTGISRFENLNINQARKQRIMKLVNHMLLFR